MAFPVIRSRMTGSISSNSTSHTITMPGTISVGDLIVVFFVIDSSPEISIDTDTSGSNWSQLDYVNATSCRAYVFSKTAEASNALLITSTASEQSAYDSYSIYNISGSDLTSTSGDSTNFDPPVLSDTPPNEDVLYIVCGCADGNVVASVAPTDFTELQTSAGSNAVHGVGISGAYRSYTYSGLYNPPAFTSNTEQWAAFTFGFWYTPSADPGFGFNIPYMQVLRI